MALLLCLYCNCCFVLFPSSHVMYRHLPKTLPPPPPKAFSDNGKRLPCQDMMLGEGEEGARIELQMDGE